MEKAIMQILPSLKQGGVEVGTIEIASALQENHIPNIVVSNGGQMVAQLEQIGVKHVQLPVHSKNPFRIWLNAKKIAKVALENNVGLMHVRSRAPAWSVWLASKKTGIPFISSYHGVYGIKPKIKKLYNSVMLKGLCTIAVSEYVKQHLMSEYHYPESKIHVIARGADFKRFNPNLFTAKHIETFIQENNIPMDKPIVTLVGRLSKIKGQLELLQAFKQMQTKELTCLLVGGKAKPEYEKELNNLMATLPEGMTVKILSVPGMKMPLVYAISNVVVSASMVPESFGRTVVEANAMKRIVVAFNHGGPTETIIDGKTGYLVPVGDTQALAGALDKALSLTADQKKSMEEAAYQNALSNFSIEKMCEKTLTLYKEILK